MKTTITRRSLSTSRVILRHLRWRVMSCCGWQAQQGIGTARPPAPLRQEAEVGGAAPGAGEGGWCEKTTKNLVKGVGMYAARCARHVSVARASTPCYFSCRLAVRVPREEHTVRRFSRGGLSSPVCRRCGCGISYLLTYLQYLYVCVSAYGAARCVERCLALQHKRSSHGRWVAHELLHP